MKSAADHHHIKQEWCGDGQDENDDLGSGTNRKKKRKYHHHRRPPSPAVTEKSPPDSPEEPCAVIEEDEDEKPLTGRRRRTKLCRSGSNSTGTNSDILLTNGAYLTQVYNPSRQVWAKHSRYLNEYVSKAETDPRLWNEEEVVEFVQSLPSCKDHGDIFSSNKIDGEAFLMLTQQDLVDILNVKLGPAIKLYNSIVLLRQNVHIYSSST